MAQGASGSKRAQFLAVQVMHDRAARDQLPRAVHALFERLTLGFPAGDLNLGTEADTTVGRIEDNDVARPAKESNGLAI